MEPTGARRYEHTTKPPLGSGLADLPVGSGVGVSDAFELERQLAGYYHILRHPKTVTPLSLAIYGTWGAGKSSAMGWLKTQLDAWTEHLRNPEWQERKESNADYRARCDELAQYPKIITANFYPWKYKKAEELWQGVLAEVILAILADKTDDLEWWTRAKEHLARVGGALGKSVLAAIKVKFGLDAKADTGGVENTRTSSDKTQKITTPKASGGVTVGAELSPKDLVEALKSELHPEDKHLNVFEEELRAFVNLALARKRRLVVFVDDLDRCEPDVAYQMLEAVKLYLNIEGIVFVFGVDEDVLQGHIRKRYLDLGVDQSEPSVGPSADASHLADALRSLKPEATEHGEEGEAKVDRDRAEASRRIAKADQYFKKLFGQEIYLVPPASGVRPYIVDLLRQGLAGFECLFDEAGESRLGRMADVILVESRSNPREAKRLVNVAITGALGAADGYDRAAWTSDRISHGIANSLLRAYLVRNGRKDWVAEESWWSFVVRWRQAMPEGVGALAPSSLIARLPASGPTREALRRAVREAKARRREADLADAKSRTDGFQKGGVELADDLAELGRTRAELLLAGFDPAFLQATLVEPFQHLVEALHLEAVMAEHRGAEQALPIDPEHPVWQAVAAGLGLPNANDLTWEEAATVTDLDLRNTEVADVTPLAGLTNLTYLDLEGTRVADVTPLAGLTNLTSLDLRNTKVADVTPLAGLTNLTYLDLWGTRVADVTPLAGLTNLTNLYLWGTQVTAQAVDALRESLPNCDIHWTPPDEA
jgi:hypothetical protein